MPQVLNGARYGIIVFAAALAPMASACTGSRGSTASGGAAGVDGSGGASPGGGAGGEATGTPIGPTFVDGTRLKAQSYSFEGAAPLFVGIYDSQEKVACEFRQATDGKLRCVPATAIGPVDPATVLPPERWQEGTESAGEATGVRLRRNRITSTDGGIFPNWITAPLVDDDRGEPCQPDTTPAADGTAVGPCLPRHARARGIDFADAACTQPLAATPAVGVVPSLIASATGDVFSVGEQVRGPTFMKLGTETAFSCVEFPAGSADYFRIGAPLPAEAVAAIRVVPRGSGRLALQTIEFQGVGLVHVRHRTLSSPFRGEGVYFDRNLGLLCRPTFTVAGELRCLPESAEYEPEGWLTNFADPGCTQPVINTKVPSVVVLRAESATGRQVAVEVRRVGDTGTTTAYTRQNNTAHECREYLKGAGYPLGDVLPLEDFARLDVRTGE